MNKIALGLLIVPSIASSMNEVKSYIHERYDRQASQGRPSTGKVPHRDQAPLRPKAVSAGNNNVNPMRRAAVSDSPMVGHKKQQ